jgi:hypothetical protein
MEQSAINLVKNDFTNLAIDLSEAREKRTEAIKAFKDADDEVTRVTDKISKLFNNIK